MTSQQLPVEFQDHDVKETYCGYDYYSDDMPLYLPEDWYGSWNYLTDRSYGKHIKEMIKFCLNYNILDKINEQEFINGDHDSFYAAMSDISIEELYMYIEMNDSKNIYNTDIHRHWKMLLIYYSIKDTTKFQILIELIKNVGISNLKHMNPYNYLVNNL